MNPQPDPPWQEKLARGRPVDRAGWAGLSAAQARDLAEEAALNEVLEALPAAPLVSNNFASRVQAAIRASGPPPAPARAWFWGIPRLGWLAGTLAAGFLALGWGVWQAQVAGHREVLAQAVADVSRTAGSAGVEVEAFAQFEVIRGLSIQATPSDEALVAALSQ